MMSKPERTITIRSILFGALVAALVAYFEVLGENSGAAIDVASTQIPVLSYVLLLFTVLGAPS